MAWRALQSGHLYGRDYDPETKQLTVQFANGAIYRYAGVDQTKVDALDQSSSPGTYFHDKIKPAHPAQMLAEGMTKNGRRSTKRY